MRLREMYEIPYDQEIIDKAHVSDRREFVSHALAELVKFRLGLVSVTLLKSLLAEHRKICLGIIAFGHVKMRQLVMSEFKIDIASLRYLRSIVQCFGNISEQRTHLLFGFEIELPAFVTHAVLIRYLLLRLNAEKDVVRHGVVREGVVNIVRSDQIYAGLLMHSKQLGIDRALVRDAVILQFQKEITVTEYPVVFKRRGLSVLVSAFKNEIRDLARQTCGKRYYPLMIALQNFIVDAGLIVETLGKAP